MKISQAVSFFYISNFVSGFPVSSICIEPSADCLAINYSTGESQSNGEVMSIYTQVWNKYFPVIRILLKKSAHGDQLLGLNRIDFEKTSRTRKPSCTFSIELVNGRLTNVARSEPARELVALLLGNEITKELLRENTYAISMNADFQLKIRNKTHSQA